MLVHRACPYENDRCRYVSEIYESIRPGFLSILQREGGRQARQEEAKNGGITVNLRKKTYKVGDLLNLSLVEM